MAVDGGCEGDVGHRMNEGYNVIIRNYNCTNGVVWSRGVVCEKY